MKTELHIIASCTDRKRVPVPPELRLRAVQEAEPDSRARCWGSRLREHPLAPLPARELYVGDHWRILLELPTLAPRARLWVASAGYGLVPAEAPLRPYSATFTRGHADSVLPRAGARAASALRRQWWRALAREPGPVAGAPRLVQQLALAAPHARFLVVASPAYVAALEEDLALAARALSNPAHLLIISSPCALSRGPLAPHWVPSCARLQPLLRGALASLHARVARHLLIRVQAEGGPVLDAAEVRGYYERLIHRSAPLARFERTPMTDDEVRQFITRELRKQKRSCSATLRLLRDNGHACEQQRFHRLFHQFQGRP